MNRFVLANILKNFRWLKIRLHDSKLKHLKCPRCYSLSLRYSIYKVQTRSFRSFLSAANFYILAHLVELVKNFFHVFSNSFLCSLRSRLSPFITQLLYVIIFTSFCQEVFSCFLKFSDLFLSFAERLAYISIPYSLCQALFYKFCILFLVILILRMKPCIPPFLVLQPATQYPSIPRYRSQIRHTQASQARQMQQENP